jgi:hypothetical protein
MTFFRDFYQQMPAGPGGGLQFGGSLAPTQSIQKQSPDEFDLPAMVMRLRQAGGPVTGIPGGASPGGLLNAERNFWRAATASRLRHGTAKSFSDGSRKVVCSPQCAEFAIGHPIE